MEGCIYTECARCGQLMRVQVEFPNEKCGFTTKKYICTHCNTENIVTDNYIYEDGKIIGMKEV